MNTKLKPEGSIAFDRSKYKSDEEFKLAIATLLLQLTKNEYEVLFRYEDCGIYIVDYCYDSYIPGLGADRYMLVTSEEESELLAKREAIEYPEYLDDEEEEDDEFGCDYDCDHCTRDNCNEPDIKEEYIPLPSDKDCPPESDIHYAC